MSDDFTYHFKKFNIGFSVIHILLFILCLGSIICIYANQLKIALLGIGVVILFTIPVGIRISDNDDINVIEDPKIF